MPLLMDKTYVEAKNRMFNESYELVERKMIEAYGEKKGISMAKGLFLSAGNKGLRVQKRAASKRKVAS